MEASTYRNDVIGTIGMAALQRAHWHRRCTTTIIYLRAKETVDLVHGGKLRCCFGLRVIGSLG